MGTRSTCGRARRRPCRSRSKRRVDQTESLQDEVNLWEGSSRRQPCRRPLAGASKGRTGVRCFKSLEVRTQGDIWYLCDVEPQVDTSELEFKWKIMTPSPYVDYYYI